MCCGSGWADLDVYCAAVGVEGDGSLDVAEVC